MTLKTLIRIAGFASLAGLGYGALAGGEPVAAAGGGEEYVLTVTRPGLLHVMDGERQTLVRSCEVPGEFGSGAMAVSPDGRTAFVLSNMWEDVYGIDIKTCEVVFSAIQSSPPIKVKTFQSVAVSTDGTELYTIQNPVEHKADRMEVMEPRLAIYEITDGLNARPVRTFPVKRRITKIAASATGEVILGGADVEAIDPRNGDTRVVTALANWDRGPLWLPPDAFAMHSQGEHVNEYIMPYVTAEFESEEWDFETANWWWGMSRVDLDTGEAVRQEIVPFEFIVFTFVSDPRAPNILYGAFNTLSKHDIETRETLIVKDLPHTYYSVNISRDGERLYIGGGAHIVAIHDSATLEKIGQIELPGDMSTADLRVARIQ
jgi:quinohemoprotein amine dehydrogenase beta subunit